MCPRLCFLPSWLLVCVTLSSLLSATLAQNPFPTPNSSPSATSTPNNSNNNTTSSNSYLFFIALGLGVVFINVWFVLGMKYFIRRRRHSPNNGTSGSTSGSGGGMYQLNSPYGNVSQSAARSARQNRRHKLILTLDQINEKFPVVTYKSWREQREAEGQPTSGGISQAQQLSLSESVSHLNNLPASVPTSLPNSRPNSRPNSIPNSPPVSRPVSRSSSPSRGILSRALGLPISRATSLKSPASNNPSRSGLVFSSSPVLISDNITDTAIDSKTKKTKTPIVTTTAIPDPDNLENNYDNNDDGNDDNVVSGDISSVRPALHERLSYLLNSNRKSRPIKDSESEIENVISHGGENTLVNSDNDAEQHHHTQDESLHDELDHIGLATVDLGDRGDICAVCLEDLEDDDSIRALTCGHVFHSHCITLWMTDRRACCPLCKKDYNDNDATDRVNTSRDTPASMNPFYSRNIGVPIYTGGWHFGLPVAWTAIPIHSRTESNSHGNGSDTNTATNNTDNNDDSTNSNGTNNDDSANANGTNTVDTTNDESIQGSGSRPGGLAHFFRRNEVDINHPRSN